MSSKIFKGRKEVFLLEGIITNEEILRFEEDELILDNENELTTAEEFVEKVRANPRLKNFYEINLAIWLKYLNSIEENLHRKREIALRKFLEVNSVCKYFGEKEWSKIFLLKKEFWKIRAA